MKNLTFIIFLALAAFQLACGQNDARNGETKPANAVENKTVENKKEAYPNLKTQAQEVGRATLEKDYGKVLDYTHPKVLEMGGGKEKMLAQMTQNPDQVLPKGFELTAVDIDDASQLEKVENQIFAVLPMKLTINSPKGKFQGESFLVGISEDGENWKFISGIDKESFRTMFPKAADVLKFPEQKQPKKLDS